MYCDLLEMPLVKFFKDFFWPFIVLCLIRVLLEYKENFFFKCPSAGALCLREHEQNNLSRQIETQLL